MNADKLLCVSGRVRDTTSPQLPKSLILLSLKSPFTHLFLSTLHVNCNHPGVCSLLSIVAETYMYHIAGLRNHINLSVGSVLLVRRLMYDLLIKNWDYYQHLAPHQHLPSIERAWIL